MGFIIIFSVGLFILVIAIYTVIYLGLDWSDRHIFHNQLALEEQARLESEELRYFMRDGESMVPVDFEEGMVPADFSEGGTLAGEWTFRTTDTNEVFTIRKRDDGGFDIILEQEQGETDV